MGRALYEGVLEAISDGSIVPTGPTGMRQDAWGNLRSTGKRAYAGYTRREYVDIGGQRIRTLMLTPYQDALLQESLGKPIALSVRGAAAEKPGRKSVAAMRTERGVEKPARRAIIGSFVYVVGVFWVFALIMSCLIVLPIMPIAALVNVFAPEIVTIIVTVGLWSACILGLLIVPFVMSYWDYRAWAAL